MPEAAASSNLGVPAPIEVEGAHQVDLEPPEALCEAPEAVCCLKADGDDPWAWRKARANASCVS